MVEEAKTAELDRNRESHIFGSETPYAEIERPAWFARALALVEHASGSDV